MGQRVEICVIFLTGTCAQVLPPLAPFRSAKCFSPTSSFPREQSRYGVATKPQKCYLADGVRGTPAINVVKFR
ncbi:hypothetical protein LZ32DRAFT_322065 [Colletotrichum eremochloae]|nr:hypothetical protein LZ32DRAFT_322065 [Colletotrichum eremochloae]